jgi:hypothetical protein
VLVRPDPDEPACHIVASVTSETRARDLLDEYSRRVREARGGEGAPGATEIIGSASPAPETAPAGLPGPGAPPTGRGGF